MKKLKCSYKIIFMMLLLFTFIGCSSQTSESYKPKDIPAGETCASCGMIVMNYDGPHAQVVWKDGKHTFYCNLFEIMPEILNKAEFERMGSIYVQDFGNKKWGSYKGDWMKAQAAIYVIDSRKLGSMGISYTPFKTEKEAKNFQKEFGGKIVKFTQITETVVEQTNKLMRNDPQTYGPKMKM